MSALMPKSFALIPAILLLALILPLVVVLLLSLGPSNTLTFPPEAWSLRWYKNVLSDAEWRVAIFNSALVASVATAITLLLFVPAGIGLGLLQKHQWVIAVFMTPFVIPPLVLAVGFYASFGQLRDTFWALPLAHSVFASPIVVLVIRNMTRNVSKSSLDAAAMHGASLRQAISDIVFPEIRLSVIATALFVFLLSFNEPIFSLYLSTPWNQTLPVKVWGSLRFNISPATAVVGSLSMAVSAILLLVALNLFARSARRVGM